MKFTQKVSVGSILEIISADVIALKYTNRGKEKTTKYVKNVQNIRVCFTLGANLISTSENKMVYMQLINSSGEIIESSENQIIVNDTATNITTFSSFDYNNTEMEHCFDWQRHSP